jgi:hypothetical protein
MTWFAFQGYPAVDLAGAQEKEAVALGFHGYATEAQANANPNSVNVLNKIYVDLIEADYSTALKDQSEPGGVNASNPLGQATAGALQGWGLHISGISGWFLRGLKVVLGSILMIIGIAKLTGADNQVTRLARAVPGAALL